MDDSPPDQEGDGAAAETAALRDLALRLLSTHNENGSLGYKVAAVEIVAGHLPASAPGPDAAPPLPRDALVPATARMVGSLVTVTQGHRVSTIILTAPDEAGALVDWFDDQVLPLGWQRLESSVAGHTALVPGFGDNETKRRYCQSDRGPSLEVSAVEVPGRPTEVRLHVDAGPTWWCNPEYRTRPRPFRRPETTIPHLRTPRDGEIRHPFVRTGSESCASSVVLLTTLDLAATVAHYTGLLVRAGWARTDAGSSAETAWSTWTFHDQQAAPWRGMFTVLAHPPDTATGRAQYFLHVNTYQAAGEAKES